jgi:integrase
MPWVEQNTTPCDKNAQFSKSKVPRLLRHRGGKYYASAKVAGKVIRRSLETDDFNVAKNLLPAALAEMKGAKNASKATSLGIAIQNEAGREDPNITVAIRHYYGQIAVALSKVARTLSDNLPTAEELAKIVGDILSQKKRYSKATAAAVEFMAYTGLRISEAQKIRWRHIKEDRLTTANAKNKNFRQVPLIPAALDLLNRLRSAGVPTGPNDPVMLVKSPRIALDNSCERLNIQHMRIHDLRHIFATRCIEGNVPLPTLAEWLGHQDGGVLCAKVHGHLCEKHSM